MNRKNFLLTGLLFFAMQTFAQNNFTFSPEKPKAGDVITISYSPSGILTNTTSPINSIVYTLGAGEKVNDLNLKRSGDKLMGTVKTDTSDNFIFFSFSADKNFDNNSNNGYWIQLYDGDNLKKGADLSLSEFYQFFGRNAGIEPDNEKALKYLDEEYKINPELKTKAAVSYLRLYGQVHKDEAPALIQKEIESEIKSGLKNEDDYLKLQSLYSIAKLPQQSKFMTGLIKEKFPEGKLAKGDYIQKYLAEKDLVKKQEMLDEISSKIKNDSTWNYLQGSLPYFQSALITAFQTNKDYSGMDAAIKKYDIKGMALAQIYNNAAWEIQQTDSDLNVAEKMAATAVDIAKKECKNPTEKKPDYLSESQYEKSRATSYAMYADTYAMINFKLKNYKKGLPYAEEAALKISKGMSADENNTYALLAEKTLSTKKYVPKLEQFVKDGKSTSGIKDILKRAYVKKHNSENGYEDYVTALEKDGDLKMIAELKKGILSDAAPAFTLVDLKGNKVNLSDLKNKVVIVDFWATWCGPCKASFPGMQKMVTKFKDDPDVKFVFVDTWETTDKKEKNAADFIAANKYDFHVLMDNESKVVDQFKVSGIPTKFVIDKNGVIRFKAIGFDGSDDKLVTELSTMIDMAKTM
ncbi:MAG TPA: TlpA disulfide reductase family protein [Hanamia sp.]|nr:TlpA disulfide reductase family protein [Hanamia sp.]